MSLRRPKPPIKGGSAPEEEEEEEEEQQRKFLGKRCTKKSGIELNILSKQLVLQQ